MPREGDEESGGPIKELEAERNLLSLRIAGGGGGVGVSEGVVAINDKEVDMAGKRAVVNGGVGGGPPVMAVDVCSSS